MKLGRQIAFSVTCHGLKYHDDIASGQCLQSNLYLSCCTKFRDTFKLWTSNLMVVSSMVCHQLIPGREAEWERFQKNVRSFKINCGRKLELFPHSFTLYASLYTSLCVVFRRVPARYTAERASGSVATQHVAGCAALYAVSSAVVSAARAFFSS